MCGLTVRTPPASGLAWQGRRFALPLHPSRAGAKPRSISRRVTGAQEIEKARTAGLWG